MVHDEQIRFRGNGKPDRGQARVHGGGDTAYRPAISHLQSIRRAVVIPDFFCAKKPVAMFDDGGKWNFRHGAIKPNFPQTAKRETL
jgi:hypothetical protein